jgi:serpin B
MRISLLGLLLLLAVTSASSAQEGGKPSSSPTRAREMGGAPSSPTDLALRLLRQTDAEQNAAVSPLSTQIAFAMAAAGAKGETRQELVDGLALGKDFLIASKSLLRRLADDGASIHLANRLWPDKKLALNKGFVGVCQEYFGAAPEALNFHDSKAARDTINRWVSETTQGKIPELLPPGVPDGSCTLALTNALYFQGTWKTSFDPKRTQKAPFHTPTGAQDTPMMSQLGPQLYFEGPDFQAVALGYKDSSLLMTVLVPNQVDGWRSLREKLTPELLARIPAEATEVKVDLRMPRFSARSSLDVIPALKTLGVHKAFTNADFSGIAPGPLLIGEAIHEAVVDVNEVGTEGAAATVVMMTRSAASSYKVEADHPFLFVISDSSTGAILFIGQVVEPEKG